MHTEHDQNPDLPSIGALVVTWNRRDDVIDCLRSLADCGYPRLRLYVVDNASSDGTYEAVEERFPDATLIRSETNLGFSGGNNLGMEQILCDDTDAVFLLNDDAIVAPDCLSVLVAGGYADPQVGVLAPKIYFHSHPNVIWSTGGAIEPRSGVSTQNHYGETDEGQADSPADLDYAVGCAMLVKTPVVRRAGMLDPRYFMYYEETDWCRRIRRAGYRIVYVPQARAWHKVAMNGRDESLYYYMRNRLLYLQSGGSPAREIARVALTDIARSAAAHELKGRRKAGKLILRGLMDFYRGSFGKMAGQR